MAFLIPTSLRIFNIQSKHIYALGAAIIGLFGAMGCEPHERKIPPPPSSLKLSSARIRVQAARLETGKLRGQLHFQGKTQAGQSTSIIAETGGKIVETRIENGQEVKTGQLLMRLDASRQQLAFKNAKTALKARKIDADWAEKDQERKEKLHAQNALSVVQLDAARTQSARAEVGIEQAEIAVQMARRALLDTQLRAPHDGEVFGLHHGVGDTVGPGLPLFEIVNLEPLKVHIALAGSQLNMLQKGQKVQVRIAEQLGRFLDGQITAIAPKADFRTGLFDVEVQAKNPLPLAEHFESKTNVLNEKNHALPIFSPKGRVRAGLVAQVLGQDEVAEAHLLVPSGAILERDGKVGVFAISDDATPQAHFLELQIGRAANGFSEVLAGGKAGLWVVLGGFNALAEGSFLEVERQKNIRYDDAEGEE